MWIWVLCGGGGGLQVKQFHPDVTGGAQNSDAMIRRVIQAYEVIVCINPFSISICVSFSCLYFVMSDHNSSFEFILHLAIHSLVSEGIFSTISVMQPTCFQGTYVVEMALMNLVSLSVDIDLLKSAWNFLTCNCRSFQLMFELELFFALICVWISIFLYFHCNRCF